jgi:spoIIIJ-associated protein
MSEQRVEVEATGETVGEARWSALHDLERRFPSLDRSAVEFVVITEGQRGLLGVGYEPARVLASVVVDESTAAAPSPPKRTERDESESAASVRELLEQVLDALGIEGDVNLAEQGGTVTATVHGSDLGLLIGKHGQTIDAIQYLANAMQYRRQEQPLEVIVDAEGYRKRRERTLHEVAVRAGAEAKRTGDPVELEPMTSVERKIVHTKVQSLGGLETASEGSEPNRYVVVRPSAGDEV